MDNRIKNQEIRKHQNLLQAAQQELDDARVSKAPASTIKFHEQRVKALEERLNKFENFGLEKRAPSDENTATATSSKKGGKKKETK